MVASIQSLNFYQLYNVAKYSNTHRGTSQQNSVFEQNKNEKPISTQQINGGQPVLSQAEVYDIFQIQTTNMQLQDAFELSNPDLIKTQANAWINIFDRNQRLKQPMESLQLYKKVVAVNAYQK